MALPRPPAGTVRVALKGNFFTSQWVNVLHLNVTGYDSADAADMSDLAGQVADSWGTIITPHCHTDLLLSECQAVLYQTSAELSSIVAVSHSGGVSGNSIPAGNAFVIGWQIAAYYRGGKPRTYVPGQAYASLANEVGFLGTFVTTMTSAANSLLAAINAITTTNLDSVTLGCLARYRAGAVLDPPQFEPFLSGIGRGGIGTIRRRIDYHE